MAGQPMPPAQQPEGGESSGQDQLSSLISNLGSGLQMLVEVVEGAGAPPQVAQQAAALLEGFSALTDALGGGAPQQGGGAAQAVAQEAGGAKASPVGPGMRA